MNYKIENGMVIMEDGTRIKLEDAVLNYVLTIEAQKEAQQLAEFVRDLKDSEKEEFVAKRKLANLCGIHPHVLANKTSFSEKISKKLLILKKNGIKIMKEIKEVINKYGLEFSDEVIKALNETKEE